MTSIEDKEEIRRLQKDLEKLTDRVAQIEARKNLVQNYVMGSCQYEFIEQATLSAYPIKERLCHKCGQWISVGNFP